MLERPEVDAQNGKEEGFGGRRGVGSVEKMRSVVNAEFKKYMKQKDIKIYTCVVCK